MVQNQIDQLWKDLKISSSVLLCIVGELAGSLTTQLPAEFRKAAIMQSHDCANFGLMNANQEILLQMMYIYPSFTMFSSFTCLLHDFFMHVSAQYYQSDHFDGPNKFAFRKSATLPSAHLPLPFGSPFRKLEITETQPFSSVFMCFQPYTDVFNSFQPFKAVFNKFLTVCNCFQLLSTTFSRFLQFLTFFNRFQQFSTVLHRCYYPQMPRDSFPGFLLCTSG